MSNTHKDQVDCFLVGIDNNDCCRRAIDFARRRTTIMKSRVVVAHVIERSPYSFNTPEANEQRHKRREEEIATATNSVLEPAIADLKGGGITAEGVVRHGNVAKVLATL